jgi:glycosyltransferase involved in cell wall biosynthesis
MRIALIADAFPPMRTSGAVQLRDLSLELLRQGHKPTVMIPTSDIDLPWLLEEMNGVQVLRLKAPRTKDIGYVSRTINEFLMPFSMRLNLRKSPLADVLWDGVVWYSPTIFLGPIVNTLKKACGCRSYLILRDIFPEWVVDMGIMRRGLPYRFFKTIEQYQYSVADVIGVQTPANVPYLDAWASQPGRRVEVLQNWLAEAPDVGCTISVADGPLAGRINFVYAGNMGVAQGMGILLDLAERLRDRDDIGFLFVGRGSDSQILRDDAKHRGLDNVVFYDEIDPSEIPGLYAQCHVGLVALDPRHKTHNIPGKFLSYMQGGLPVLASINPGNDLAEIIEYEGVGRVCTDHSVDSLERLAKNLVGEIVADTKISARCRDLSAKLFSPKAAVRQIAASFDTADRGSVQDKP